MAMTDKRWREVQRIYREQVKIIRSHLQFEDLTFSYHPESEAARREVASLVPELISEVRRCRRQRVTAL